MKLEDEIKSKPFTSAVEKVIVNTIYTANWLSYHHARLLKKYDLSLQQYNILRILRGQYPNPATINLLKERMLDKMSNASRLVEKLRKKHLIQREICPDDRRAVDIIITQKGLELLNTIERDLSELQNHLIHLNPNELDLLNNLLNKLRG